jgi:5-methylcytosine-specific restriction endonuclease McrA
MNEKTRLRKKADELAWAISIKKFGIDCEICNEPMEDVHHCYRKGTHPNLRYDFDNLSIVCRKCHDMPDAIILDELEKKRGKAWRKRLDKKAKMDIHGCDTLSWYKHNLKKLEVIMGKCFGAQSGSF